MKLLKLKKPNQLTVIANNDLSLIQKKAYNVILHDAQQEIKKKNNKDITVFYFSISDLKKRTGIGATNNKQLKEGLQELSKVIVETIKEKRENWGAFSLIGAYEKEDDLLKIQLPFQITEALFKCDYFTEFNLIDMKKLNLKYSVIFYELALRYEGIEIPKYTIEEFKKLLGIETFVDENGKIKNTTYDNFSNIRTKILEPAFEELKEKVDLILSYDTEIRKKKVISIKLKVLKNRKLIKETETAPKTYSEEVEMLYKKIKEIERIDSIKKVIEESITAYGVERVESNIKYSNDNSKTNYTAYLKKALKEDYAMIEREKKLKKAEIKRKREEEEQEKTERKEREKQELKELKNYLIKSEEGVFAVRYRDNKFIKKDVVTFDMYLEILIETTEELKLELQKRRNNISKYLHQLEREEKAIILNEDEKEILKLSAKGLNLSAPACKYIQL